MQVINTSSNTSKATIRLQVKEIRTQIKTLTADKRLSIQQLRFIREQDLVNPARTVTKKSIRSAYTLSYRQIMNQYKAQVQTIKEQIKNIRAPLTTHCSSPQAQDDVTTIPEVLVNTDVIIKQGRRIQPTLIAEATFDREQQDLFWQATSDSQNMAVVCSKLLMYKSYITDYETKINSVLEQVAAEVPLQIFNTSINSNNMHDIRVIVIFNKEHLGVIQAIPEFKSCYCARVHGFTQQDYITASQLRSDRCLMIALRDAYDFQPIQ